MTDDRPAGPHHISLDGHRLEYAWVGPPPDRAPTLVFLHEGLGCVAMWKDFPARLAAATGCGALIYSRLGYGGSDPVTWPRPVDYHDAEANRVLPALLQATGVRQSVLVGHSDGATIALMYAANRGRDDAGLRGVAAMAPHVFNETVAIEGIRSARHAYEQGDLRARLARYHGDNVDCAFYGWNDTWLTPEFRDWNIEHVLPRIRIPLLVIQGEDDHYGTMAQVNAIAAGASGPVRTMPLSDCRHVPHAEQPETTKRALTEFIGNIRARVQ